MEDYSLEISCVRLGERGELQIYRCHFVPHVIPFLGAVLFVLGFLEPQFGSLDLVHTSRESYI